MTEQETLSKLLFDKYQKLTLSPKEAAETLNISVKSLESYRANAIGLPYTRITNKERGKIMYTVTSIAKYLVEQQIKTV